MPASCSCRPIPESAPPTSPNTQLRDLALNGRNIHDLAKLIPGVAQPGGANEVSNLSAIGSYSINGNRVTMKDMSIDGSSVTRTDQQAQQVTINPDAVGEVKVLTSNYQAEYGKAGGGIVTVTTKGGGRDFHVDARWFHRHDSLNANSYFNNLSGRPRALYRYNYYGFDVSGPVYIPKSAFNRSKSKLFFFYNEEWYKQLMPQASAQNVEMPTALERNGDFSQSVNGNGAPIIVRDSGNCLGTSGSGTALPFPGNVIPKSCFFPGAQAVLNLFPTPNTSIGGNQYNYTSQVSSHYPRREDIVRVDYLLNDKNRLSGRLINNYDDQVLVYGTTTLSDELPDAGSGGPQRLGLQLRVHVHEHHLTHSDQRSHLRTRQVRHQHRAPPPMAFREPLPASIRRCCSPTPTSRMT